MQALPSTVGRREEGDNREQTIKAQGPFVSHQARTSARLGLLRRIQKPSGMRRLYTTTHLAVLLSCRRSSFLSKKNKNRRHRAPYKGSGTNSVAPLTTGTSIQSCLPVLFRGTWAQWDSASDAPMDFRSRLPPPFVLALLPALSDADRFDSHRIRSRDAMRCFRARAGGRTNV